MLFEAKDLRATRGAAFTVLGAMWMAKRDGIANVMAKEVAGYCGYNVKTVSTCLEDLQRLGYVLSMGRYKWQLVGDYVQFPFIVDESYPQVYPQDEPDNDAGSVKFTDPDALVVVNSNINNNVNINYKELEQNDRNILPIDERLQVLSSFGINEPALSTIARDASITMNMIKFHCEDAPNTGAAISRLKKHWKVPKKWIEKQEESMPWLKYLEDVQ